MRDSPPAAGFLNVDLEVRSRFDLEPLVDALEARGLFRLCADKHGDTYFASFEHEGRNRSDPDAAIRPMARTLADLPLSLRRHWRRAEDRVFDVGIEATRGKVVAALGLLRPPTMKLVFSLGARVAVTIYYRDSKR